MSRPSQEAVDFGALVAVEAADEFLMMALDIVREVQADRSIFTTGAAADEICERLVKVFAPNRPAGGKTDV